ncbi:MAG: ferrochelatase [Deltaproteobacteria bacterium]|nr:ferrochelatase [Deltaproteobacteria bacterium]
MDTTPPPAPQYDALLVLSFGGPEKADDVMPFLEAVVRGRGVPKERLEEVATHYARFGGKSPLNDENRQLVAALRQAFITKGPELKVYFGNRNWHPLLEDTLRKMRDDGVERALVFATSAFGSYSGCRQYQEDLERAREAVGEDAPELSKLRLFHNHPGFIEAQVARVEQALERVPEERRAGARLAFTAHSIPLSMDATSPYRDQLEESCRLVAEELGKREWQLVFQSRSGPPEVPWLEPDVVDHLDALALIGVRDLVVVPIGFLAEHMEVVWDLDVDATQRAQELGIELYRAGTVGAHPRFVEMIRELVVERFEPGSRRPSLGVLGPSPDVCSGDCCAYTRGRPAATGCPA